jgi:hypothetical protein
MFICIEHASWVASGLPALGSVFMRVVTRGLQADDNTQFPNMCHNGWDCGP